MYREGGRYTRAPRAKSCQPGRAGHVRLRVTTHDLRPYLRKLPQAHAADATGKAVPL